MPRIRELDIDLANVDADGLADGNSSAGSSVTLDGALTSGGTFTSADGLGRYIAITDAGADDQSTATYTITGTDSNDKALTEAITGPTSSGTVISTEAFKTVTSVAIASPVASSTVDIGTTAATRVAVSKVYPLNHVSRDAALVSLDVTGTINVDIQETFDIIQGDYDHTNAVWFDVASLASKTADTTSLITRGATALRVLINSYSDGAECQVVINQPRN